MVGTVLTLNYTGGNQSLVVPSGVTSISYDIQGGPGGGSGSGLGGGGRVQGLLATTPGETLVIVVGGGGALNSGSAAGAGGFNGGGPGGAATGTGASTGGRGGGGASDIRRGGSALGNRIVVAGGGGGSSGNQFGGGGGGTTGGTNGTNGGAGGTPTAGGAIGAGGGGAPTAGSSGQGGNGGANGGTANPHFGGGGGAGGYFGGGGGGVTITTGATAGSGGGGSSFTEGTSSSVTHTQNYNTASNGVAVLIYNAPPTVTPVSPANNTGADATTAIPFTWTYADSDGDPQVQADFRYRIVGAGSWTTLTNVAVSVPGFLMGANTLVNGNQYEWQVQVYDVVSPPDVSGWSSSFFLNATLPPAVAPTFTAPATGAVLAANPTTVTWTTPLTQQSFQVRILNDVSGSPGSTELYNSGEQITATHSFAMPVTQSNGTVVHPEVRYSQYSGSGLWSPWAQNGAETVNISPPPAPGLTATPSNVTASVLLTITNTGSPSYNRVYRLDNTHAGSVEVLIKDQLAPSTNFTDYTPAHGVSYTYRVQAVSSTGAVASTSATPAAITLVRAWLIDPLNPTTAIVVAGSLPGGRRGEQATDGEVRKYSAGRRRSVTRPGTDQTIPITLVWLTEAQLTQLRAWRGTVLLYRDTFGRRIFGAFFIGGDTYFGGLSTLKGNYDFTLTEVTFSEVLGV